MPQMWQNCISDMPKDKLRKEQWIIEKARRFEAVHRSVSNLFQADEWTFAVFLLATIGYPVRAAA